MSARQLLLMMLLLNFIGCAGRPGPPWPDAASDEAIEFQGKVGVTWPGERFSARFYWQQSGPIYQLDLWGPLGQGRLRLRGDAAQLAVLDAGGRVVEQGSVDSVMESQLGWSMPLALLPQWAGGRPSLSHPFIIDSRDPDGRITHFRQFGWQVAIEAFMAPDAAVPKRIRLGRAPYTVLIAFSRSVGLASVKAANQN